jgi:CBS domain-containing protein
MRVSDIMTPNLVCCESESPARDAARLMCENDVGAIPVLDAQKRPVGILTDRDIACRAVAADRDARQVPVREIMSKPVVSVTPETEVDEACEIMERHQLRRVLVVDEAGAVAGIVALADIARHASKKETAEVVKEVSKPTHREVRASF